MDNRYKLGIYEKALPNQLSFEDKLKYTKKFGFDQLEISIDESDEKMERIFNNYKEEVKKAQEKTGIRVRTMCLSGHRKWPLGSEDEKTRKTSLEIMRKAIEFCDYNSIRIIQLAGYDVYYDKSNEKTEELFRQNLKEAVDYASKYGVILAFETMETEFMDTVEKAMKYVNYINSPYLGIYPDIGNLKNAAVKYGHDVVDDLKKGRGHIFAAHLKETKPGIYRDMIFGKGGHTEYESCIKELKSQGVNIYTGEFWNHGEENFEEIIRDASKFLREKLS